MVGGKINGLYDPLPVGKSEQKLLDFVTSGCQSLLQPERWGQRAGNGRADGLHALSRCGRCLPGGADPRIAGEAAARQCIFIPTRSWVLSPVLSLPPGSDSAFP